MTARLSGHRRGSAAAFLLAAGLAFPVVAQRVSDTGPVPPPSRTAIVVRAQAFDISPPLRDIVPLKSVPGQHVDVDFELPLHGRRIGDDGDDERRGNTGTTASTSMLAIPKTPAVTRPRLAVDGFLPLATPSFGTAWEGVGGGRAGSSNCACSPPDDQGDVGPSHVFHWVNTDFIIFDKAGNKVYPAAAASAAGNTIWSGFTGGQSQCSGTNRGDPLVYYDQLSNRWLISQFAFATNAVTGAILAPASANFKGYWQCVAVSVTSDPTGAWYRYAFPSQNGATWIFNDYGKGAIWWDAFYVTANQFDLSQPAANQWYGAGVYAYDRNAMVTGNAAASYIYYNLGTNYGGLLPTDVDGAVAPVNGTPALFWSFDNTVAGCGTAAQTGCLQMWHFKPNWTTPANSAFKGTLDGTPGVAAPYVLQTQAITVPCAAFTRTACIPQSGTTNKLEALGDRLLERVSYRNFMDASNPHESVVLQHGHDPAVANNESVIRWYEIRDPNGTPTLYQQGNVAPLDGKARFGGSIAIDRNQNIGLLYHRSSSTQVPEIMYTGRTPADPLNTMEAEQSVPTNARAAWTSSTRWGDYFSINADPANDCTFFGFGMYASAAATWNTRIFSFNLPGCSTCTAPAVPAGVTVTSINSNDNRISWSAVTGANYYVYRADSACPNGVFRRLTVNPVSSTTFDDTMVVPGTTYYYQVSAVDATTGICESNRSGSDASPCASPSVTTAACTPAAVPTLSTVTGGPGGGQITVTWGAVAAATGGYRIYRANGACPGNTYAQVGTVAAGVTTFTDSTATANATYSYRVASVSAANCVSAMSSCLSGTAPACTTPGVPGGVTATVPSTNTIHLAWTAGVPAAATYSIYRSSGACPGGTFSLLAGGITATAYDDSGLTGGSAYSYTIVAVDNTGNCSSVQSSCAGATATGGPGLFSRGRSNSSRPEDTTSAGTATRWIYSSGASTLTPPGVGSVYAVSNDRALHGLVGGGGAGGGLWPASWTPWLTNAPSQARPPVPGVTIGTATKEIFLGAQDGNVYAIDANTGALLWKTAAPLGDMIQAAVGGIFTAYGGAFDLLVAGTRNSSTPNAVYGLSPSTGATKWLFNNGGGATGVGIITGDPFFDYGAVNPSKNKVYFTSRALSGGSGGTVWCLDITGTTANLCSEPGAAWPVAIGDTDSAPTLFNNRLYIGTNAGVVYCLNPLTGATIWSLNAGDGPIKGFVDPDWMAGALPYRLFVATSTQVAALTDNGATASVAWTQAIPSPAVPLYTGSALYVGSSDGRLYELSNVNATPTVKSVVLGTGTYAVGSPSYDFGNGVAYVGTDQGRLYAVTVPLP
jgi:outer membrane protein assembly factor BamB/fibronectin type 3 domain-containing protein